MIEIIKNIFNLMTSFINRLYNIELDLTDTMTVKLGTLILAFIFFVLTILVILKSIGIKKPTDNEGGE